MLGKEKCMLHIDRCNVAQHWDWAEERADGTEIADYIGRTTASATQYIFL